MKTLTLLFVRAISFLLVMSVFGVLFASPLQLAVNHTFSPEALTAVFGTPYLTFSKSFYLVLASSLLFRTAK